MRDLALAVQDVDGNENGAELQTCQVEIDYLDAVREIDADPVAGLDPAPAKRLRHAVRSHVDIAESVRAAVKLQRGSVAAANQREIEQVEQVHTIGLMH